MDELTLMLAAAVVVVITSVCRVVWLVMEVIDRTGWDVARKAGLMFVVLVAVTARPMWRRQSGEEEGSDEL